jgi:transcriptional regulator with XRE-family HTH domain
MHKTKRRHSGSSSTSGREEFSALLRRFRIRAALSQGALAELARLSVEAVSALERGLRRSPYRKTVSQLATALDLNAAERQSLETASQRPRRPRGRQIATKC